MIVPGNVKGLLIKGCCLLERFFIGRYLGKTLVDGLRDILDNAKWVVGFRVCIGMFPGLEKGLCVPFFKSRVTSRKLTVCLFTSIVILRPFFAEDGTKLPLNQICLSGS